MGKKWEDHIRITCHCPPSSPVFRSSSLPLATVVIRHILLALLVVTAVRLSLWLGAEGCRLRAPYPKPFKP